MIPVRRINVMVHPRLRHARDSGPRDARSRRDIVGERLVGPVDGYGILRRDLLIQGIRLDSNDAFGVVSSYRQTDLL